MFSLNEIQIGVVASFVASLLQLIPYLNATTQRRNITAIVCIIVAGFAFSDFVWTSVGAFLTQFFQIGVYAVIAYKLIFENFLKKPAENALKKI